MVIWSEELAEVYGALLGDGCLSTYKSGGRRHYVVLFAGHTRDDSYYVGVIRPVFEKIFNFSGYLRYRKDYNSVLLSFHSKKVFDFFRNIGFPVGVKGELSIPNKAFLETNLALACIRGIFQTDGSIYNRYSKAYVGHAKHYNYKNIQFKMNAKNLLQQIKSILERVRIKSGNIRKDGNSFVLTIHTQSSVKRFYELVKPNHPYYVERFLN